MAGFWIVFWTAFVLGITVVGVSFKYPKYIPAILLWFVLMGILHNQMLPYNKNFGFLWIGAWWLSFHAMMFAFSPDMPWLWYPMMAIIVFGLGFGFRPDQSLLGFYLWSITIIVVRIVLFCIYLLYIVNKNTANLFPFNLFSHKWRLSNPRWFPLSLRPLDPLNNPSLCERCDALTRKSRLIMGSSSYITYLVEWHDFWSKDELASRFKEPKDKQEATNQPKDKQEATKQPLPFPEPSCHLCCLIWYSMSPRRQEEIAASVKPTGDTQLEDSSLSRPQDPSAELRVKVWEERPLSLYTYMQLFCGEIAVGARLLVHREELFTTR